MIYNFKKYCVFKETMSNLCTRFRDRYPNANFSIFKTENFFGKQNMFVGPDEEIAVFADDGKNLDLVCISQK